MNTYFDNATTSYPKPDAMRQALAHFYDVPVGSYGRSRDRETLRVTSEVEELRDALADLIGVSEPAHICFADNATTGINTILRGSLQAGCSVLVSPMEHNAVMRPLQCLADTIGLKIALMPSMPDGRVDTDRLVDTIPTDTALAVVNLESNVNGLVQPIEEIARLLTQECGIPILADATQYLGTSRLKADELGLAYVAFTGHKGLLGPSGTGGFYIRDPRSVHPLTTGGNGLHSANWTVGVEMPERFMAGTVNVLGLTALLASVRQLPPFRIGRDAWKQCMQQMQRFPGLRVYGAADPIEQGYLCSLTHDRLTPARIGDALYEAFDIVTRTGIHCAPLAHRSIGTFASGTVRLSLSPYHEEADLEYLLNALSHVLRS